MRTHGTPSTYNWGCRCPDCREANARATAARRKTFLQQGLCACGEKVVPERSLCAVHLEQLRDRVRRRRSQAHIS